MNTQALKAALQQQDPAMLRTLADALREDLNAQQEEPQEEDASRRRVRSNAVTALPSRRLKQGRRRPS